MIKVKICMENGGRIEFIEHTTETIPFREREWLVVLDPNSIRNNYLFSSIVAYSCQSVLLPSWKENEKMINLSEEEYRKFWREKGPSVNAIVSIRVMSPEGKEGYADLTHGIYLGSLPAEEFARAIKTFLPNLIPGISWSTTK